MKSNHTKIKRLCNNKFKLVFNIFKNIVLQLEPVHVHFII